MRYLTGLFLSLVMLAACRSAPEQSPANYTPQFRAKFDSLAQRYHQLGRFSGLVWVLNADSSLFKKYYGQANYEQSRGFTDTTAFKIGQISELFTRLLVAELEQKNLLKMQAPASDYLPELRADYTVEELLNHQSGLPSLASLQPAGDSAYSAVALANAAPLDTTNGASNLGYNLLGLIIEQATGLSYQASLDTYLAKYNFANTWYQPKDALQPLAQGYVHQGLALKPAPSYPEEETFSSRGIKSSAPDILSLSRYFPELALEGYTPEDGFSYALHKDEASGLTIIILSNRRHPVAGEISQAIQAIWLNQSYRLPLARQRVAVPNDSLLAYAGRYQLNEQVLLTIEADSQQLLLLMGPNKMPLIPQATNQFYMLQTDAAIRFIRDTEGQVHYAELLDGFIEGARAPKLN